MPLEHISSFRIRLCALFRLCLRCLWKRVRSAPAAAATAAAIWACAVAPDRECFDGHTVATRCKQLPETFDTHRGEERGARELATAALWLGPLREKLKITALSRRIGEKHRTNGLAFWNTRTTSINQRGG